MEVKHSDSASLGSTKHPKNEGLRIVGMLVVCPKSKVFVCQYLYLCVVLCLFCFFALSSPAASHPGPGP